MTTDIQQRQLAHTGIYVRPVAMGCWPIAGMTSVDVNEADSLATIEAALEAGINFFDTAFCYGADGESERAIGRVLKGRRENCVVATKGGIHWDASGNRQFDATPARLRRECEESLRRLGMDYVDLLYLHAPDPNLPVQESAAGLKQLLDEGKTRCVGVSNLSVEEMEQFQQHCPISVVQPPYNMLQRDIERDLLPWCRERDISVAVYWPLMKGLLAGKLARDHQFHPHDGRAKYPMFHGEEWRKNQDFLDELRSIAGETGRTVAQVVINWTMHQPGITAVLCGAKRPFQIEETSAAMHWQLSPQQLAKIESAIVRRGHPLTRSPV